MASKCGFALNLVILLSSFRFIYAGTTVQKSGLTVPSQYSAYKADVVNMFNNSYSAYRTYAWGHDVLSPNTLSYSDNLGGWGASLVDALGNLYIMGFDAEFLEAVDFVESINFNQTRNGNDTVNVFETSIHYIGGLLSAYEISDFRYPALLSKAEEIGNKLLPAFPSDGIPSIPYNYVNIATGKPIQGTTNVAQAGGLTLEFSHLSLYTGDDSFRSLAENAALSIIYQTSPIPGLPSMAIDPSSGDWVLPLYITWGPGMDTFFEYTIKYPRTSESTKPDTIWADLWKLAIESSMDTLQRTSTTGGWTYLADWNEGEIIHVGSHMECFSGGNWIFGGSLLPDQGIIDVGLELADACWNTYARTLSGLGPDVFYYMSSDGNLTNAGTLTADQVDFNSQAGFYMGTSGTDYLLRPEVMETNFYAWRITGDTKYLDRAVTAINSLNEYAAGLLGYAGLNNVDAIYEGQLNAMDPSWFATLKYLYLTFDDPATYSLDSYVFTTNGHLLKSPATATSYVSPAGLSYTWQTDPIKTTTGPYPIVSPNPALPESYNDIFGY